MLILGQDETYWKGKQVWDLDGGNGGGWVDGNKRGVKDTFLVHEGAMSVREILT